MNDLMAQTWFAWTLGLIIGFPSLVIILGELANTLKRRKNALSEPISSLRNAVLPTLALQVFLFNIVGLDYASITGRIFVTVFWIVIIYVALSFLSVLLFEQAAQESWRANVPTLFRDLSRFILVLIGFAIIFSTVWNQDLSSLITALGVGSLVIGLALQDTLSNLFSGIAILFEKPYAEGDWIEIDGTVGKVSAINWRATRIQTRDGDMVVIPNSVVASSKVLNESRPAGAGYESYLIGFSYDDPPNKVKRVMLETIQTTRGVVADPVAMVRTISYDDSSITYQVRFAIEDFSALPTIKDEFATRVWYAAKRNGLSIPFPIRTLFHYDGSTVDKNADEKALSSSLSHLAQLSNIEQNDDFFDEVSLKHFAANEVILTEGEKSKVMFTILSGEVRLCLQSPRGEQHLLALTKGDVFGVSSLLRSDPSHTTVIATTDVDLVALSQDAVMQMVRRKPSFARELEEIIESRESLVALSQN